MPVTQSVPLREIVFPAIVVTKWGVCHLMASTRFVQYQMWEWIKGGWYQEMQIIDFEGKIFVVEEAANQRPVEGVFRPLWERRYRIGTADLRIRESGHKAFDDIQKLLVAEFTEESSYASMPAFDEIRAKLTTAMDFEGLKHALKPIFDWDIKNMSDEDYTAWDRR
jgi:hypothetical protein